MKLTQAPSELAGGMPSSFSRLWPQVKTYRVHETGSQSNLFELWKHEQLCDVALVSQDGRSIPAHSIILASVSGYFRALLTGAGRIMKKGCLQDELDREKLVVDNAPYDLLLALVTAVYEDQIQVSGGILAELLSLASYLQINPMLSACCLYLRSHLSLATCLDTLVLTAQYAGKELHEEVLTFVCSRFSDLHSSEHLESLSQLPLEVLLEVLMHDELDVDSESEVMEVALRWVQAQPNERLPHLPTLLQAVRSEAVLQRAPPDVLDVVERWSSSQSASCSPCSERGWPQGGAHGAANPVDGFKLHAVGSPGQSMMWVTHSCRPRSHGTSRLLVTGGRDSTWQTLKQTEIYDPLKDEWLVGPVMPRSCSFAACAQVRREVFVIGGSTYMTGVTKFDARSSVWQSMESWMGTARMHAGVTGTAGYVYVLGGRSHPSTHQAQSVRPTAERLVLGSNTWQYLADMGVPRYAHGCAAASGRVYVIGGQGEKSLLDCSEWYDPGSDRWVREGARLQGKRKYTAACNLGGRLFVVGGINEARLRLASMEWLDPREGKWHLGAPMMTPRSSCGLAALRGVMYVVGGSTVVDGEDTCDCRVEVYHPAMDRWTSCAPISIPRSGLCAAAI